MAKQQLLYVFKFLFLIPLFDHAWTHWPYCLKEDYGGCCYSTEHEKDYNLYLSLIHDVSCIYVDLASSAWLQVYGHPSSNMSFNETRQVIREKPPTEHGKPLNITTDNFWIESVTVSEYSQTIKMTGVLHLQWEDKRLKWGKQYKAGSIKLKEDDVWHPAAYHLKDDPHSGHIRASSDGVLHYFIKFQATETCPFDYTYYPFDEHTCCTSFYIYPYPDASDERSNVLYKIKPDLKNHPTSFNAGMSRLWKDTVVYVTDESGNVSPWDEPPTQAVCIRFERGSASAVNEIILPLSVSIVLSILLPMCSRGLKMQLYSKIFCLCLQFACSFVLTLHTETLQFGSTTPRLLVLHQLVMWTSLLSLLSTLLIWNLSKRSYRLPPPFSVMKIANFANSLLRWCSTDKGDEDEHVLAVIAAKALAEKAASSGDPERSGSVDVGSVILREQKSLQEGKEAWQAVWSALHRVLQMLFVYVYVIGGFCLLL